MRTVSNRSPLMMSTSSLDRVQSFLYATAVLVLGTFLVLLVIWLCNVDSRLSPPFVGGDLGIELIAGQPSPPAAQLVASPEDVTDDPSVRVAASTWAEVAELIEHISVSDAQLVNEPPGGRKGGGPNEDGPITIVVPPPAPRPERWVFMIDGVRDLADYASLLQQFQIDIGTFDSGNRFAYLDNITAPRPSVRRPKSARDERFYTSWAGGDLAAFDWQLFRNAGLESRDGQFVHFFPERLERELTAFERQATRAAGRRMRDVRRTWFAIDRSEERFGFRVVRQQWR